MARGPTAPFRPLYFYDAQGTI